MKFTKKPVTIEAFQFQRRNNGPVPYPDWFDDAVTRNDIITHNTGKFHDPTQPAYCEIKTLEGVMRADEGDWIIRGIKGEIYPCKPDIFEATYSPASPAPASAQQEPAAYGLFAMVEGQWVLQHPVRFTRAECEQDRRMYRSDTKFKIEPLGVIQQEQGDAVRDAKRWQTVEKADSTLTLRLHNSRPDRRAAVIDAALRATNTEGKEQQ